MEKGTVINLSAALSLFSDHLPDIRKACVENIRAAEATYTPRQYFADDDEMTKENIRLHLNHLQFEQQTAPMARVIKRIDGRKRHYNNPNSITDADIERAREYPIQELWQELVGTPVRNGMTQCPFHPDNTPSLSLKKYNRYKCFGCNEGGDVIDLYMKVNKVSFIQAVKSLQ